VLLLALACSRSTPDPDAEDVLIVVVDSLRADALDAGKAQDATPTLRALESESVVFRRAYASAPWRLPSMATLLTGLQPWEHLAVRDVLMPGRFGVLSRWHETLPETFQDRGYRTAAWMGSSILSAELGLDQGFDRYTAEPLDGDVPTSKETVGEFLEWVDSGEGPYFAVVHLLDPMPPYAPAEVCAGRFTSDSAMQGPTTEADTARWRERRPEDPETDFVRAIYLEEVCTSDEAIGELIEGLEGRGRWERTTLVVTSDHGDELWDWGNYGHGHSVHSVLTHVPLLVRSPGLEAHENRSIVGHAEFVRALRDQRGPVWKLMETGASVEGRTAFSDAPSKTLDQLTYIDEERRVILMPDSKSAIIWALDERGWEKEVASVYTSEKRLRESPEYARLAEVVEEPLDPVLPAWTSRRDDVYTDAWKKLHEEP